ncbi:hypothetical protein B9Z55_020745 [Caenorhabditis nigoni]|uniref:DUF19 domain-containing protein n=1 Tax=Caenorhabditis nigoni TaxID=1611254 RepID=A0A2G5TNY2_9PELO|nr:hypothetical protein B9Z55_020745 [Caenorhabditis nigoni]
MCQMSAQANILIGIKTLIILIPLLLTIRFGVIHLYEDSEECPKDERLEFDRCSLINQISGRNECAQDFLDSEFFEKSHEAKCQVMANNKGCIHESVSRTCAKVMADVLAQVK